MRLLFGTLFGLALAAVIGLGLTYYTLTRGAAFGGLSIESWTAWPKSGTTDADPYERASIARSGRLPIAMGDGVSFTLTSDDDGKSLDGRCEVVVSGITPAARFWTVTLYNRDGGLVANSTNRYGFTSQEVVRHADGSFEIVVAPRANRGFHVRPSTLVARVTYHYGSPVTMTLDEETYDAASPLDLFRANELINAKKRRWLAQEIARIMDGDEDWVLDGVARVVRDVIMRLAEEGKVIVYEHPLPPVEGKGAEGQPLLTFVVDAVAKLQALGKIDIVTTVTATFRGDRRVLADIEKLAASGYGEDAYGNNIALPEPLRYLRR